MNIYNSALLISEDENISVNAVLLFYIWPLEIVYSVDYLREMMIQAFFVASLFHFLVWIKDNRGASFIKAILLIVLCSMAHSGMVGVLIGYICGIIGFNRGYCLKAEKTLFNIYKEVSPDVVFCDFSCYGSLLKKIKKHNKGIKIISFFHDIEVNYEKNRMKNESILYYFSKKSAYSQEKKTIKYSDKIICLNDRDDSELKRIYGRKSDYQLPVFLEDRFIQTNSENVDGDYFLFVGSLFNPNLDGITWYSKEIAPFLNKKTIVVGKNFETVKDIIGENNIEVIGTVDDTSQYYYGATAVVMPIRYGDGMKVKTAEALMYGKTVVGTEEAFEGYSIVDGKEGFLANTSIEFINILNNTNFKKINLYSRELFKTRYSLESSEKLIEKMIDNLLTEEEKK